MIRLTQKIFSDLAIYMIGFGFIIGAMFPFFLRILGVPDQIVFTPWFFIVCLLAGILVGGANIILAKMIIGPRLNILSNGMRVVRTKLETAYQTHRLEDCTAEDCFLAVDSDDELGESARSFNCLVDSLSYFQKTEATVRDFNEVLGTHLELKDLSEKALSRLLEYSGSIAGAILIESDGEMIISASHGIQSPELILNSDHVRAAARYEKRYIVSIPDNVTIQGVLVNFQPKSIIVDPLIYKQTTLGMIVLASAMDFTKQEQDRLDLYKKSFALAVSNSITHDRLQRLAAIDPLTGLYNRRFGMDRLNEEFSRSVRQNSPLGILMFDIDHFKSVNDTYGHLVGDHILSAIASNCRTPLREGDVLMRYGGEEFLAILPAASKKDAIKIGERLRRVVEETSIKEGDQQIRVTISLGGTSYPEAEAEAKDDLIASADKALYSAKESGRNKLIMA